MTKLLRKILLSAVVLCISLGAAIFAAACGEETCKYSVTVACEELSQAQLDTLGVKLVGSDGKASEGKTLKNARADFELSPATYTVELYGDLLEDYTYSATSVTKEKPDVTVTLSPKAQEPDDGDKKDKIDYTVTVTCESAPNVLSDISVKIFAEGSETPVAAQPLTNGSARFSLAPGNYTVTLSDTLGMLAEFDYDSDITLTADAPSVTVVLTPKINEPDGSEDYPFELTDALTGDYTFTPKKIEVDQGWETLAEYTRVYYTYTPAAEETYTFTTSVNYLWLIIEDERGETVLDNNSGNDRFYRVFTLSAGAKYTMYAQADNGNGTYREGDPLTWKIQSGEQPQPDVMFTVTVTCDDSTLLATLKAGLYKADGTLAAEEKALTNGSVSFTLAPATYTVKLSGEGLDEYSYAEKTVSQASPTAEIKLTKKADVKKWRSGTGTESDPYVVDPLTGKYSVPTEGDGSVYIKYVAAEAGKYILTAESDDLFMSMTQGNKTLVKFYFDSAGIPNAFDVVAGTVKMEVRNFSGNNAPVTFTITRADGSFDPEKGPSDPDAPDLTAFVGTWTDANGRKLIVTPDTIVYTEQNQTYSAQVVSAENGLMKFDFQKGTEAVHYAVRISGDKLELLDCGADGNESTLLTTLSQNDEQGSGQGGEGESGSEKNPIVWETIVGEHKVQLPAGDDNGQPSVYYAYTATESRIYSLSYTMGGKTFRDLNLTIYPEGDRQHAVAAWNTADQAYAFPFTAGRRYIFRLSDGSESGAGGELLFTVAEATLSFPSAYEGTWVDANEPAYTVKVDRAATAVTVNEQPVTGLTLAPFNGGYTFVWDGKTCNIAIGKTQSGAYERVMIFSVGEESLPLYHPGSVPEIEYGTEEHPKPMTQGELVKEWSDNLSAGEFYWTVTATETKIYTLTTTIDHLHISITDTQTQRIILYWKDSEAVKSAVFELTAGHTYLLNYTDSAAEDGTRSRPISFRIAEGGDLKRATLPKELLGIEWVDEQNSQNALSFTETEVTASVNFLNMFMNGYVGYIGSVQETATGYVITFVSEKKGTAGTTCTLTFDRTTMTIQFVAGNASCTFKAKTKA